MLYYVSWLLKVKLRALSTFRMLLVNAANPGNADDAQAAVCATLQLDR